MRGGVLCIATLAVLLLTACGGGGGSGSTDARLSAAAYGAQIAKIGREAAGAQSRVAGALQAKSVGELSQMVASFAAETQRIGDEVAKLNPPLNAEAANTQLAQGLHDIASATSAANAKIAKTKTVPAAIKYLEHSSGARRGSREVTGALTTLDALGYSSGG